MYQTRSVGPGIFSSSWKALNFPCNHLQIRIWYLGQECFLISVVSSWVFLVGPVIWATGTVYMLLTYSFSCFLSREVIPISTKVSFASFLVCVVNNTWTWLATNVLCKLNLLPGSFSENQRNDGGRELIWRNLNQHLQEILPPAPPSHLSLNKASKCFRGLKGTL